MRLYILLEYVLLSWGVTVFILLVVSYTLHTTLYSLYLKVLENNTMLRAIKEQADNIQVNVGEAVPILAQPQDINSSICSSGHRLQHMVVE